MVSSVERTTAAGVRPGGDLSDDLGVRAAYAAHGAELYRFALRGLGDRGLAEDVVQESFLRAWQAADRFDPELASLRVWLFAIARHVMIDLHRRRSRRPLTLVETDDMDAAVRSPEVDVAEAIRARAVVGEALARLSEDHRQVIVQTYLRGCSYDELSAECGVPPGTLRSRMFYALKALRVAMDEMGVS